MKLRIKLFLLISIVIIMFLGLSSTIIIHRSFNFALEQIVYQYNREHINFRIFYEALYLEDVYSDNGSDINAKLNSGEFVSSVITAGIYTENSDVVVSSLSNETQALFLEELIQMQNGYIIKSDNGRNILGIISKISLGDENIYLITANDISEVYFQRDEQYGQLFSITIALTALAVILVLIILRKLTTPLNVLTATSREISAGAYNKRTKIHSKDEIGILSDSFDKMAEVIEEKIKILEQEVCAREDFVSNFSHELKTPMTSIMGYADMLRSYESDPETQIKAANYIYEESKQLNALSLKLMELMSLTEGQIEQTTIDTQTLKANITDDVVEREFEVATVIADKLLIQKVIANLTQNSKNAGATKITIKGEIKGDYYIISVIDNGCGISKEEIEKITQPFYQTNKARSKKAGGFGLGLALCERILITHDTKLTIESVPNEYTCVHFKLKVQK